jgi:hypothetical protein
MKDEILEKYLEAGKTASSILKESAQDILIGRSYLDLVEFVEALVRDRGADLAFPLNVSLNGCRLFKSGLGHSCFSILIHENLFKADSSHILPTRSFHQGASN